MEANNLKHIKLPKCVCGHIPQEHTEEGVCEHQNGTLGHDCNCPGYPLNKLTGEAKGRTLYLDSRLVRLSDETFQRLLAIGPTPQAAIEHLLDAHDLSK